MAVHRPTVKRAALRDINNVDNMTFHAFTFAVEGAGLFPWHMLNKDFCMPKDDRNYITAFQLHTGLRKVELIGFRPAGSRLAPASREWLQQGWPIVLNSVAVVPE